MSLRGHECLVRARVIMLVVWLAAMIGISTSLACGNCNVFCGGPPPTQILVANNLGITSLASSCPNIRISGSSVIGDLDDHSETCPVDIHLSNGEHFTFDVPFTQHCKACCCGSCTEGFEAAWDAVDASAPPPPPDASPFPPSDASDVHSESAADVVAD
jgi:hypothetical protein